MAHCYQEEGRFQLGLMDDAAECFVSMGVAVDLYFMWVWVYVCVWGAKDQREFGINVRKEEVKRVRGICRRQ